MTENETPISWKQTINTDTSPIQIDRFWELLGDPVLDDLEEQAIQANSDLLIAATRIDQAKALVKKEHSKRVPHINFNGSAEADQTLINPRFFGSPHQLERVEQRQYNFLSEFTYEIDLWGKIKAQETSARHRSDAAEWEYAFVYQSIVTEVAARYITIRTLDEQIRFLKQSVQARQESVDLHSSRVEAGYESELDLSRAKLELSNAQVELEIINRLRAIEENALAILVGKTPSSWSLKDGDLPQIIPTPPSILPSDVLIRRADIQRQLSLVAAGRSDVDVAIRDYFPSFPLIGQLGLSSPTLKNLFEWEARYWQYAFNILAPLYDGGKRKAQVKIQKSAFREAFLNYQKTVNRAFQDVEDALSSIHYLQLQSEAQERALLSAQDTCLLANDRYQSGLISYLLVADSEQTSLKVSRNFIALKGERLIAWIHLMKALGVQLSPRRVDQTVPCSHPDQQP
jgi:NodT family efflux transporter outer membrane factor (OMF) lipoprotein